MKTLYVGIDVGKFQCWIHAFTEKNAMVFSRKVDTLDEEGWQKLFSGWQQKHEVRACFEVGSHYEWMYDFLHEYCVEVEMINPAQFALIARSKIKTDRKDAQKLAEGIRRGDLPGVYVPKKWVRADRRFISFIHKHSNRLGSVKTRLRSVLQTFRMECPYTDILSEKSEKWWKEIWGQFDEGTQMMLEMLLEEGRLLKTQRAKLDKELPKRLARYDEAGRIVDSIPGFGPLTSLAIISAIVEIGRFPEMRHLRSYFGTCGSVHQSGNRLHLGSLTKSGNKTVRWLLSQALQSLHRRDAQARRRYQRLKRKKPCGVARGAQVNWLVGLVFHLLKSGENYRVRGVKRSVPVPKRMKRA